MHGTAREGRRGIAQFRFPRHSCGLAAPVDGCTTAKGDGEASYRAIVGRDGEVTREGAPPPSGFVQREISRSGNGRVFLCFRVSLKIAPRPGKPLHFSETLLKSPTPTTRKNGHPPPQPEVWRGSRHLPREFFATLPSAPSAPPSLPPPARGGRKGACTRESAPGDALLARQQTGDGVALRSLSLAR